MMAAPNLQPDVATIEAHIRWFTQRWHELGVPLQIEVRSFGSTVMPLHDRFPFSDDGIADAAAWAADLNEHPGRNVYMVINPLRDGVLSGEGGSATDADVVASCLHWAEADDEAQTSRIRNWAGPKWAAYTITGREPESRVHVYWPFREWCRDLAAWKATQQAIAHHLDTDRQVVNPSRVMRLAGSINWPKKGKPGRVAELVTWRTMPDAQAQDRETFARLFTPRPGPQIEPQGGLVLQRTPDPLDRDAAAHAALSGREWHNNMVRLVASYVARGLEDHEIHAMTDRLTLPGYTVEQTRREVQQAIDGARRKGWGDRPENVTSFAPQHNENSEIGGEEVTSLTPGALTGEILDAIPPRRWVYGHKFLRGFVSVIGSPGGVGKSTILTGMFIDMASGVCRLHDEPLRQLRVWYFNLEDPADEQLRKVAAYLRHHKVPLDCLDNLKVNSGRDRRLIVADQDRFGNVVATPDAPALIEACKAAGIDVLCVDPMVRAHRLDENDNSHIDYVADLFSRVASEANIAVILVHHSRKGFVSGDADTFRGGSALISAARSAYTLAPMSAEEAKDFGIAPDDRARFIRMDNAKANLAPRAMTAEWYRLASYSIGNGDGEYPHGDSVGVVERWQPPGSADGLSADLVNEILAGIERGIPWPDATDRDHKDRYSDRPQDKRRWVGDFITAICDEHGIERTEGQNKQLVRDWLASGLLEIVEYRTRDRKDAKGLRRAGRAGEQAPDE